MKTFLIISVIAYVILTIGGAAAALTATIEIYTSWGRELPETLTAAIINTAAIFAATSFIGVLDMFMTLWTLLKSKDWEEEARKEREKEREENRQARAAEQATREKELEENRQARAAEQAAREKEREESRKLREAELQAREKELEISRQARVAEQQAREKEFAANHQLREAELQARLQSMEAERFAREQAVRENRDFQQRILDELAADRAAQAQMTTRVLDLLEEMSHRINGNHNGNGSRE